MDMADRWLITQGHYQASKKEWLATHKEFLAWKKTKAYKIWRKRQFGKQRGQCYYCLYDLTKVKTNIDHIEPKSKGGNNHPRNLVLTCWSCNKDKNSEMLTKSQRRRYYRRYIQRQVDYKAEMLLANELRIMFEQG